MVSKKNVTLEKSNMKVNTIIGEDAVFTGNLAIKDTIRIDGTINGDVKTDGVLILGSTGTIEGSVEADTVFCGGMVKGNINAGYKVEASSTAKIYGDIKTKLIVIDENAVFQGSCDMSQINPEKQNKAKE